MQHFWRQLTSTLVLVSWCAALGTAAVAHASGALRAAESAAAHAAQREPPSPPSALFGQLFIDVQLARMFHDQKTFCDLVPLEAPAILLAEYHAGKTAPHFSLAHFVATHFRAPANGPHVQPAPPRTPIVAYVAGLWNVLLQHTGDVAPYSSLISLPHSYVVPGGRFREVYYWDSYFTMLGLEADGRHRITHEMVANFAYEIDRYGLIPNGNRTYYLSRSQPPFFSKMIDLLAATDGPRAYVRYLPELAREYAYWMRGAETVSRGGAYRNVVRLSDGTLLNRYWDARDVPRDESYAQDVQTAHAAHRPAADVYRNLRAAAESGWDFSSRWLADEHDLATIQTLTLLPVDLNSLLEHLERTLARAYTLRGDPKRAQLFSAKADTRGAAIRRLMWDSRLHVFGDYSWRTGRLTQRVTAATLYPLFFEIATQRQADMVASTVERRFLRPNGVATSLTISGQQWDEPNGWAPLQWIAVAGFNRYGHTRLARTIARRWMHVNGKVYATHGKLVEKYDLLTASGGGGGEYATQIGFGWTNGVLRKMMTLYP